MVRTSLNFNRPNPGTFSLRALQTLAAFGLTVDDLHLRARHEPEQRIAALARDIDALVLPGAVALLTGPSGAGKSRVLEALARLANRRPASTDRVVPVESASRMLRFRASAVDVVSARRGERGLDEALTTLGAAGLADARLMVTPVSRMSEGERWRVALARAMDRALAAPAPRVTLIADEFASSLDAVTARSVAGALARWVRRPGSPVRAIVAANRPEIAAALAADHIIDLPCAWAW